MRRDDLERAAAAGIIAAAQVEPLWRFLTALASRPDVDLAHGQRFGVVQVLWYGGALIVMGAMSLFATLAFELMGGPALTVIGLAYAIAFTVAGDRLWRRELTVPGGLLIAIAVGMMPLSVYGVQETMGWWTDTPLGYRDFYAWIKAGWLPMEIVTILVGVLALRFYPFPFIVMPIAVCLWFMSMDLTPWIFGEHWNEWAQRKIVSLYFGLGVLVVA